MVYDRGCFTLESQSFCVVSVLEEVQGIVRFKAHKKKLSFAIEYPPGALAAVLGDPLRLRQILLNLTRNAITFTPSGYVRLFVQQEEQDDTHLALRFSVEDSGIGNHGDTGPGLSISTALAEHMGGKITVVSEVGKGSCFSLHLRLPLDKDTPAPSAPVAENAPVDITGLRILIAEDMLPNQLYLKAVLKKQHCNCDIANNGLEAVKMTRAKPYDVIFMDMHMPHINGEEATRIIQQESGARSPVIIALTADVSQEERERCLKAGMDHYLAKPVKTATIVDILKQVRSGGFRKQAV